MRFIESQIVLHTINTLLGLKPFLYNADRQKMERKWVLMLYSFLVATVWQTIHVYLCVKGVIFTDRVASEFSNIDYVVGGIQMFSGFIFINFITVNALLNSQKQLEVLNHLIKIENIIIAKHNLSPDCRLMRRETNTIVAVVAVLYFIVVYSVYVQIFPADVAHWILFYLIQCFMVTMCGKNLENQCAFLEMCAKVANNQLNTQVLELLEVYDQLCRSFSMLSQGFGLTIVGITAYNCFSGITQAYDVYVTLRSRYSNVNYLVYTMINLAWTLQLLVAQATLGYKAGGVVVEMQFFSKSFGYSRDWRLAAQTEDFLIKDLHVDKAITAYGFYTLNESTIFSVFCSIITYVVILLEFKQLEDE